MRRRTILLVAAAAALATLPRPGWTQEVAPRAQDFAAIAMTSLGYVRPAERFAEGVNVLALHSGDLSSRTLANDVAGAIRAWGVANEGGGKLAVRSAVSEAYDGPEALTRRLTDGRFNVVFVSEGLRSAVAELSRVTREKDCLTMCASRDLVELGLSMGFVVEERHLRIHINRDAASAEGVNFHSALLRRAKIVEARR